MPWKECSAASQRVEFVRLARPESANLAVLCRRFGISRKTGYRHRLMTAAKTHYDFSVLANRLTESLAVGYHLSPRHRADLNQDVRRQE